MKILWVLKNIFVIVKFLESLETKALRKELDKVIDGIQELESRLDPHEKEMISDKVLDFLERLIGIPEK